MLDMGAPVKIVDLAKDLITLSGLEVGRDIEIVYTGIRPGEKLFEELFVSGEHYQPTPHKKILLAANSSSRIPDLLELSLANLKDAVTSGQRDAVLRSLCRLVPEFQPDETRLGTSAARPVTGGASVVPVREARATPRSAGNHISFADAQACTCITSPSER